MISIPIFSDIKSQEIKDTVEKIINHNEQAIQKLLASNNKSWNKFILPLDNLADDLDQYWGRVYHLNNVANTPDLRKAHDSCLEILTAYSNEISKIRIYIKHTSLLVNKLI